MGARAGRNFSAERKLDSVNLFEATVDHANKLAAAGKRVLFASWSEGSSDRLSHMLADHGLKKLPLAPYWDAARSADRASESSEESVGGLPCARTLERAGRFRATRRRH